MSRAQITYEVYVQSNGRWMLHARFDGHQREEAMEEAKQLDAQPSAGHVKVIREMYNPANNMSEDSTIFMSAELKKEEEAQKAGKKVSRPAGGGGGGGAGRGRAEAPAPEKSKGKAKKGKATASSGGGAGQTLAVGFIGVLTRVLVVLLLSVLGAAILAFTTSYGLSAFNVSRGLGANMTFAAFVIGFIGSAVLLMKKYLPVNQLSFASSGGGSSRRKPRRSRRAARASRLTRRSAAAAAEALPAVETKPGDAAAEAQNKEDRAEAEAKAKEEAEKQPGDEPQKKKKKKKKDNALSDENAERQQAVMSFVADSMKAVAAKRPNLDAYNKFGFNLFLAGACGVVSDDSGMDSDAARQMLQNCLESNGTKAHLAKTFIDKYEDYLLDQKYLDMFNAGRAAMSRQANNDANAVKLLANSMDKWNKPVAESRTSAPVTVMFTDLTGSTAMTQRLGDEKAQIVVRTHNTIVRAALQKYGGKEIKHTGDGIMAQFMTASGAVEGAIEIQRATAQHNKSNKELAFYICIGLHSGEAISEDDDLFGTTVQMSARTCSKAESEEILVTDIVRQLCSGKTNLKFNDHGKWEMKGYDQPVPLFIVPWK